MKIFIHTFWILFLIGCHKQNNFNQAEYLKMVDKNIQELSKTSDTSFLLKVNQQFDSVRKNLVHPDFNWRKALADIYLKNGLYDSSLYDIKEIKDTAGLELKIALFQLGWNTKLALSTLVQDLSPFESYGVVKLYPNENTSEIYLGRELDSLTSDIIIGYFDRNKGTVVTEDASNVNIRFTDGHYIVEAPGIKSKNIMLRIAHLDSSYSYYWVSGEKYGN